MYSLLERYLKKSDQKYSLSTPFLSELLLCCAHNMSQIYEILTGLNSGLFALTANIAKIQ